MPSLTDLARRCGHAYARTGAVAAVVVAGSVGRGRADPYSDLELDVYWTRPPSDDDRIGIVRAVGADLETLWPYEPAEGEWSEDYRVDGQSVGISGFLVEWVDEALTSVIEDACADIGLQMRLSAIQEGFPVVGADLVDAWRTRSARYPDALATATAELFLHPARLGSWHQRFALLARADAVILRGLCAHPPQLILGTLCALNRVFIEHPAFKWYASLASRFDIAPDDLAGRLHAASNGDLPTAVTELDALIVETLDLVDAHLHSVSTGQVRAELARTR